MFPAFCFCNDMDYNSKRWQRLREKILKRDNYMCQYSWMNGRRIPATMVHHIFPVEVYPEYQWCEWNLISLSNEAHNMMHERYSHKLSQMGEALRKQTAIKRGMEGKQTILIIGNINTGKTTYVRERIGNGVAYDLDAIAGALRLKKPKAELFTPARLMANDLIHGFTEAAHRYVDNVFIIRTAPTIEEVEEIRPTKIVVLYGCYGNKQLSDKRRHDIAKRIIECVEYAKANNILLEEIETNR